MSVYIKGMEMPTSCYDCNCFIRDSDGSDYCCLLMQDIEDNSKRDDDCPLVPAADVQPVRHGRWIKTVGENGVTSACRCSLCGFEDNRYSLFNYCPNCGAKMDKENE